MNSRTAKRLNLARETVRALNSTDLNRAHGGISGQIGCHSIQDRCEPGSGGALCVSKGICVSVFQSDCTCD